ncbi:fad-binding oxidoreductase [Lasius niger]|uniref:Fad-binding oxidoreductase n=1 Tax=Lasius niger TaxID=67767 RepID=A0A0J7KJI3_LASNI|nr:fad-binding oxidoreductase [Lasius niger]
MGLRTALGYRNSTPTNVIIGESKVMTIADRAGFLARNTLAKIIAYGEPSTRNVVADYIQEEDKYRHKIPWKTRTILSDAWKDCWKYVDVLTSKNLKSFPVTIRLSLIICQ